MSLTRKTCADIKWVMLLESFSQLELETLDTEFMFLFRVWTADVTNLHALTLIVVQRLTVRPQDFTSSTWDDYKTWRKWQTWNTWARRAAELNLHEVLFVIWLRDQHWKIYSISADWLTSVNLCKKKGVLNGIYRKINFIILLKKKGKSKAKKYFLILFK